jgi:hypothetical protein
MPNFIKIANIRKSNKGFMISGTDGVEFYANQDLGSKAKVGFYAATIATKIDTTPKLDAQGNPVVVNGTVQYVPLPADQWRDFNKATAIFETQADYFRAKNSSTLDQVAEAVFLKKERKALLNDAGMTDEELKEELQRVLDLA